MPFDGSHNRSLSHEAIIAALAEANLDGDWANAVRRKTRQPWATRTVGPRKSAVPWRSGGEGEPQGRRGPVHCLDGRVSAKDGSENDPAHEHLHGASVRGPLDPHEARSMQVSESGPRGRLHAPGALAGARGPCGVHNRMARSAGGDGRVRPAYALPTGVCSRGAEGGWRRAEPGGFAVPHREVREQARPPGCSPLRRSTTSAHGSSIAKAPMK